MYLKLMKKNWRMSTCDWLDLENTGISTDYAQNLLPEYVHCINEFLSTDKGGFKNFQSWLHLVVFYSFCPGEKAPDLKTKVSVTLLHGWIHQISPKKQMFQMVDSPDWGCICMYLDCFVCIFIYNEMALEGTRMISP